MEFNINSSIDTSIDDDEAGAARRKFRTASAQNRAQRAARISAENRALKSRLAQITAKTDDGDGLLGQRPTDDWREETKVRLAVELQYRDFAADWYLKQMQMHDAGHRERMAKMTSSIDDDTEDDATGVARARLKADSAAKRQEAANRLKEENANYFAMLNSTRTVLDTKVWDDGAGSAGAMRSVVAARARERREKEAQRIAAENEVYRTRMANARPETDDGDGCIDGGEVHT